MLKSYARPAATSTCKCIIGAEACTLQEVVLLLPCPCDVRPRQAVPRGRELQQGHDQVPRAAARHEDGADVGTDEHQAEATTRTQDAEGGAGFGFVVTTILLSLFMFGELSLMSAY